MKSIKTIFALLIAVVLFASCNKTKYTSGAAVVSGKVTYVDGVTGTNTPAYYADVHINYNSLTVKTPYDLTVQTDSAGAFSVKLPTGDYYFSADFTDAHGFKYSTSKGSAVQVKNTKDDITTVAIEVK
jgi:hypothetical protein